MDRLQKERFSGYSRQYDAYRPSIPIKTLRLIIGLYTETDGIDIADIGCGTGLSTFPWAEYARSVIGVEPNVEMIGFWRILKRNGTVAIYDYDWPPSIGRSLETIFREVIETSRDVLRREGAEAGQWPKGQHLSNIDASGLFRFAKEVCFHETAMLNAEGSIGMIESQGAVQQAIKTGTVRMTDLLEKHKAKIRSEMGKDGRTAILTYRLRIAVK
jgi:hypothetical protein